MIKFLNNEKEIEIIFQDCYNRRIISTYDGGLLHEKTQILGFCNDSLSFYDSLYRLQAQISQEDGNMLDCLEKINKKAAGVFAVGVLFGTAGVKVLSSKDAKKVYTHITAAVLRAKDCVMKTAASVQENAEDIYAEAQQINEERAAKEDEMIDTEEWNEEKEEESFQEVTE